MRARIPDPGSRFGGSFTALLHRHWRVAHRKVRGRAEWERRSGVGGKWKEGNAWCVTVECGRCCSCDDARKKQPCEIGRAHV